MESERGIKHENRDPITHAPGAHPIGTGIGAIGAGATGMAIGGAIGPIGAVIGAAVGSVVGGLIGKGVAEVIDPTAEEAYWRNEYHDQPYFETAYTFDDDYLPAYRYGWETRHLTDEKHSFDDVETPLEESWHTARSESKLEWEKAKHAARDAWEKIERDRSVARNGESNTLNDNGETLPPDGEDPSRR